MRNDGEGQLDLFTGGEYPSDGADNVGNNITGLSGVSSGGVNSILNLSNISATEVIDNIESLIEHLQDLISIYDNSLDLFSSALNNEKLRGEILYITSILEDIDSRRNKIMSQGTSGEKLHQGFSTQELFFVWKQVAHLVTPSSRIKSYFDIADVISEEYAEHEILNTLALIKSNLPYLITKLKEYSAMLQDDTNSKTKLTELEKIIQDECPDIEIQTRGDIANGAYMNRLLLKVITDNLTSNYLKYGKDGVVDIEFSPDSFTITFSNTKKSTEELGGVISSNFGNEILIALVRDVLRGNVEITQDETNYCVTVTNIPMKIPKVR